MCVRLPSNLVFAFILDTYGKDLDGCFDDPPIMIYDYTTELITIEFQLSLEYVMWFLQFHWLKI